MKNKHFDCNCMLGPRADGRPGEPTTLAELLADMDHYNIDKALVCSATSRDYDPSEGNQELAKIIEGATNLSLSWTLPAMEAIQKPAQTIEAFLTSSGKAVTAYPASHSFSLSPWALSGFLSRLENLAVPMLVPRSEVNWGDVHKLCTEYPNLPIIITRVGYRELHDLYALWTKHTNLFIDSSWLSIHRGLEGIQQAGYLQQILFGSYYPYYDPGGPVGILELANLTDKQKLQVGTNNLETLLSWRKD
jgi:predicted TIM-barrel fold metal-dependent hydrolase